MFTFSENDDELLKNIAKKIARDLYLMPTRTHHLHLSSFSLDFGNCFYTRDNTNIVYLVDVVFLNNETLQITPKTSFFNVGNPAFNVFVSALKESMRPDVKLELNAI